MERLEHVQLWVIVDLRRASFYLLLSEIPKVKRNDVFRL